MKRLYISTCTIQDISSKYIPDDEKKMKERGERKRERGKKIRQEAKRIRAATAYCMKTTVCIVKRAMGEGLK